MTKKRRRAIPLRPVQAGRPLEVRSVGDKGRLLFARIQGPMDLALAAAQQARDIAFQVTGEAMLEWEGLDADDGWKLNVTTMRWERYPVQTEG